MVKTWTVLLCLKVKICLTRNYCQLDYLHPNVEFPGCSFGLIQIKAMFLILMLSWPLCAAKFCFASVPIPFTGYVHDFMWLTIDNHLDISIWDVSFIILTYRMKKWGDYKKREKRENRKGIDKFLFLFNKTKKIIINKVKKRSMWMKKRNVYFSSKLIIFLKLKKKTFLILRYVRNRKNLIILSPTFIKTI